MDRHPPVPVRRGAYQRTGTGRPDPLAPVHALLAWAGAHGIHLVNVFELFHATAPMTLHTPYAIELNQRLPRAFAAASDHLRVEVVYRFGGLYADGDLPFTPSNVDGQGPDSGPGYRLFRGRWHGSADPDGPARLPELFDRVAASWHGFTLNALTDQIVLNDVILAPAGYPALALWLEGARYNYLRDQRELFGAVTQPEPAVTQPASPDAAAKPTAESSAAEAPVGEPAAWTWAVTPTRTGRVHHWLLSRLDISAADLVKPAPAVCGYSELSSPTKAPPQPSGRGFHPPPHRHPQ